MKAKWIGAGTAAAALAAAVLAVACGDDRVIFDVDVFSFLNAGADTVHYTVPIVITDSVQNTPIKMNLPAGLGKSAVDSVTLSGTANIVNNTGSGNVIFRIFIDTSSATTYSGAPFMSTGGAAGPGTTTTPISASATVVGDSRFLNQTLWVGVRARVAATAAPIDGKVQVTGLRLRVVLKPKLF